MNPYGPKLALGETGAGKIVTDNVEILAQTKQELGKVIYAREILSRKFDEQLFEEFKEKRRKLKHKMHMQKTGRWVIRTTIVGGAIVATVLTLGPGASAFALEPAFEKVIIPQRRAEKQAKKDLEDEFRRKANDGSRLKDIDSQWLWDKNMKDIEDVERTYSLKSSSADDILEIVKQGEGVGIAMTETETETGTDGDMTVKEFADFEVSDDSEFNDEE